MYSKATRGGSPARTLALGALATIAISACATAPAYESTQQQQTRTLTFMSTDNSGDAVTQQDIVEGIAVSAAQASQFDVVRGYRTQSTLNGAVYQNFEGVAGNYNDNNGDFEIHYANWAKKPSDTFALGSNLVVPFSMSIEPGASTTTVSLTNKRVVKDSIFLPTNPLTSKAQAEADAVNAVMNGEMFVPRQELIEGEFDSQYPDNAVYANYERLLGEYSAETAPDYYSNVDTVLEIEKGNVFVIKKDDFEHLVQVSVFPYRNGSKVTYTFIYTYGLTGDGGSTYSQAEIDGIIGEIQTVANN